MSEKYPNECCRCGYCCLVENCPASQLLFQVPKHGERCPALKFYGTEAFCEVYQMINGIDEGCCIKARAIKGGITYDFAALESGIKKMVAKRWLLRQFAGKGN